MVNELSWKDLVERKDPGILGVVGSEAQLERFIWAAPRQGDLVLRVLRGKRSSSSAGLFQEWAAALQFPYYFGHNWDALDECLADLEWLPARRYVFVLSEFQAVLMNSASDLASYIKVLRRTLSNRNERDFSDSADDPDQLEMQTIILVVQCPPEHADMVKSRLRELGVDDMEWTSLPV
jgi:hypothetical protein